MEGDQKSGVSAPVGEVKRNLVRTQNPLITVLFAGKRRRDVGGDAGRDFISSKRFSTSSRQFSKNGRNLLTNRIIRILRHGQDNLMTKNQKGLVTSPFPTTSPRIP